MLQSPTGKNSPQQIQLTLQVPPNPNDIFHFPRSPVFARKGALGKRDKGIESLKSSEERSVQKSLRFTKILPREWKNEDSEVHSEVNIIHMLTGKLEDSRETVIHRGRSRSQNKDIFLYPKKTSPKPKTPGKKVLEDFSAINDSHRKSKINNKNDDHYVYWKNKAYQYLDTNIKLMDQVRKLMRENNDLKAANAELEQKLKAKAETDQNRIYSEKALNRELRNISSIYIGKIESMEKELKRKEISIASFQITIKQLNSKIAGDSDRIRLMAAMEQEIEALKSEVWSRKIEHLKLQNNHYESTSILIPDSSNR